MDGSMAGESKRDRMIIDHDIVKGAYGPINVDEQGEDFLTGERSAIIIENKEEPIKIEWKAFPRCNINDISIGKNTYIFASAFYQCTIKRFTIQADAPRPTETIFWQCRIGTLIVQQIKEDVNGGKTLVKSLIHETDEVTTIDNILLIFPGGHQYLRRALRM